MLFIKSDKLITFVSDFKHEKQAFVYKISFFFVLQKHTEGSIL